MVEVTQEDIQAVRAFHNAAAAYMLLALKDKSVAEALGDHNTDHPIYQAFAAHRQAAFNAGRASVLAELESPTEAMVDGWIVGNVDGTKWRSMDAAMPTWVDDPADAIRYARRIDAEVSHAEDEDAWRIIQFSTVMEIRAYKEAL